MRVTPGDGCASNVQCAHGLDKNTADRSPPVTPGALIRNECASSPVERRQPANKHFVTRYRRRAMRRAEGIHRCLADQWPLTLVRLGIPIKALRNKHGPCPGCGGTDRFRFDHERRGKGSFWCNNVKSGDGFALLQHVYGWSFTEAVARVVDAA
jgi:hypothetical protein